MLEDFLTDELTLAIAVGGEPDPLNLAQRLANGFELSGFVAALGRASVRNPIPLSRRVSTVSINCFIDRASRSSFHTMSVSPLRANSSASCNAGRSATAPDICSMKIFPHPASVSASRCKARFWSTVDTRA